MVQYNFKFILYTEKKYQRVISLLSTWYLMYVLSFAVFLSLVDGIKFDIVFFNNITWGLPSFIIFFTLCEPLSIFFDYLNWGALLTAIVFLCGEIIGFFYIIYGRTKWLIVSGLLVCLKIIISMTIILIGVQGAPAHV